MGTRNLTMVVQGGEIRIAQYGQRDGYPSSQGVTILNYLRENGVEKLKKQLSKVRFLDAEGKDKEFVEAYNKNTPTYMNDPDNRTKEQKRWWSVFMSRDIGGEILCNIAESEDDEIIIYNDADFIKDSGACEWAYLVDLEHGKLEVYVGSQKTPLEKDQRFYSEKPDKHGYYPCKMIKSYDLSGLPSDDVFIEELNALDSDGE